MILFYYGIPCFLHHHNGIIIPTNMKRMEEEST